MIVPKHLKPSRYRATIFPTRAGDERGRRGSEVNKYRAQSRQSQKRRRLERRCLNKVKFEAKINMSNPSFDEEEAGPFVVCRKHGTCRMSCASECNTGKLEDPKKDEAWAKRWKAKRAANLFDLHAHQA